MMIRWIFFDVGNVILNDDPVLAIIYKRIHDAIRETGESITFDGFLREREKLLAGADGKIQRTLAIRYLGLQGYRETRRAYHRYLLKNLKQVYPLMPEIVPIVQRLHSRYRLALLANQPAAVETVLRGHAIWNLFERHFVSEVVQLCKPDPEFFLHALRECDCEPEEAIMVGDRFDNDIVPAQSVGMRTIWFVPPIDSKGYVPVEAWEKAFFDSLRRASHADRSFIDRQVRPDVVARSFDEILSAVETIRRVSETGDAVPPD